MVDLDLLYFFPKNGQESLEGRVGIKLSRFTTMEEREEKKLCWKNGEEAPFIGGHKKWPLGQKCLSPTARPGAGQHPGQAGRASSAASDAEDSALGSRPRDPALGRPARGKAGQPPEPAGLIPAWAGRPACAWAGRPPEAPGLEPASGPARPAGLFFFLFLFLNFCLKNF